MNLESVAKKLFVGTGLVLGAAIALAPMATHAAVITQDKDNGDGTSSHTCYEDSLSSSSPVRVSCEKGMEVAFNVQPTISVDAYSETSGEGGSPIVLSPTVIREGTFSASVIANTSYSLSLSADHGITSMQHETNADGLIPASSSLVGGTAGWGIKTSGTTEGEGTYKAITETPVVYKENLPAAATAAVTDFTVGIAASPNLPSGIYSATIVVTATAK